MTWYQFVPTQEAPQPAAPQTGWDRLREAQNEAKRNAQVPPLEPAPAPAAASVPVAVCLANPVTVFEPPKTYYYYAVLQPSHQIIL